MKRAFLFTVMIAVTLSVVMLQSCDTDLTKVDKKPAESALAVMSAFSNIILLVDDGMVPDSSAKGGMRIAGEEYTETITGDYPNKLYTWDFGTDGKYQGIVKLLMSDEYTNAGAIIQATFENFIYNGKAVAGVFNFENLGKNGNEQDEYNFNLDQAQVGDNILTAGWKLQRTGGGDTPPQSDDVFTVSQIDAEATGTTDDGRSYTLNITEGLVLDLTCEYIITQGIFDIVFDGNTLTANFGNGECDNLVKTSNGILSADVFF